MTFEEVFATVVDAAPAGIRTREVDYHDGVFVAALLGLAGAVCDQARQDSVDALEAMSLRIIDEAVGARGQAGDDAGLAVLDVLVLQVATGVAATAARLGEVGRPHEWVIRAMTDGYHGNADYVFQWQRLLGWTWLPGPLRSFALSAALGWLEVVFTQAAKVGDHVVVAEQASPYVDVILRDERARADMPQLAIVAALTARLGWAAARCRGDLDRTLSALDELLEDQALEPDLRAHIEASIALSPVALRDTPQAELAQAVLDTHGDRLRPAERLRLLVTSCWGDIDRMRARAGDILDAIAHTRAAIASQADDLADIRFGEGRTFEAIAPLVRAYSEAGDTAGLVQVLGAWLGVDDLDASWHPLIAITSHPVGTLWVANGTATPPADTPYDGHAALVAAANAYLSTTVIYRDSEDLGLVEVANPGVPVSEHADAFESAAMQHLHIESLGQLLELGGRPSEAIFVPTMTLPIQALLGRELDYVPALSVSLQRPHAARPVRQVLFLGDNTITSGLELAAVRCVLERAGIQVHDVRASTATFRAAYGDDQIDVVWVAAHGEFEHLTPDASRLVLSHDDEALDVSTLASLNTRVDGRRLLVLNVCDGAVSATLGGPAGLGIGPVLAGPSQSVISNCGRSTRS